MSFLKDLKWLKVILQVTNVLLLIALFVFALHIYENWMLGNNLPENYYEQTMLQLEQRKVTLLDKKAQRQQELADRIAQIEAAEAEAQAAHDAAEDGLSKANGQLTQLEDNKLAAQTALDKLATQIEFTQNIQANVVALRTEYGQTVRRFEDMILNGETEYKICYLTFDDGPSYYTDDFLDELDRLDVYATFFTIGVQMDEHNWHMRDDYLRRQALGGHTIANHTYTHAIYGTLYNSTDTFMDAVMKQDEVVYAATGLHTDIVRFPAGSHYSSHRSADIEALAAAGFGWIDWTGNAYDSGGTEYSAATTASIVVWQVRQEQISVVLMHDWKLQTLGALDTIVTTLKAENYVFLPLFKESWTIGNVRPKWD